MYKNQIKGYEKMLKLFCPDLYIKNIYSLNLSFFKEKNIQGLLLDLDNTLLPWNSYHVNDELKEWIDNCKKENISLCMISNNRSSRIKRCAENLGIPAVTGTVKPRKKAFKKGLKILETNRNETAVIGDQIFTDIFGAKRMGLFAILVEPMSKNEFLWTRIMRFLERILLKKMKKRNLLSFKRDI